MRKLFLLSIIALGFASCGSDSAQTKSESKTKKEENCSYTMLVDSSKASFTAYKFTNKQGVGGKFDSVMVSKNKVGKSLREAIVGTEFTIPVKSLNTNNTQRNGRIYEHFFMKLIEGKSITGTFTALEGNNENGSATVNLRLNGMEQNVRLSYMTIGNKLQLVGAMDLVNWKAEDAVASLNKVCYDLHKGEDGISKTWSEVSLKLETKFIKECK